jgi:hypothetical protein
VTTTVSSQPVPAVVPAPGAPVISPPPTIPDDGPATTNEVSGAGTTQSAPAPTAVALKLLRVRIQLAGTVSTTQTRITRLLVFAPRGALVVARCSGTRQGCPEAGLRKKVRTGGQVRLATMERRLGTGARIVVSVAKTGYATRRVVLTMRAGKAPSRRDACLLPAGGGKTKEGRCPAA